MTQLMIELPSEYVVLTRDEYQELKEKSDERIWVGLKELEELTGLKRNKLDDILTRYRDELDIKNGGPVKYPDGGKWNFNKRATLKWLENNHSRIWSDDPYYS